MLEKKKKRAYAVQTIFLKVAHVLLLVVLCSKMAVLLIRSPTFSLKNNFLKIIERGN